MEVPATTTSNVLLDHRAVEAQLGFLTTADLNLRTQEGDVVNLSFSNEFNFAGSQSQTTTAEGATVEQFSSVAQAASRYSLSVQGDLNEDELAAIQRLVEGVQPIAQEFFLNGEFDVEAATGTLVASLDQLQEVELRLERVISAALGIETAQVSEPDAAPAEAPELNAYNTDAAQLLEADPEAPSPVFPRIRDLNALVESVVDTEFPARALETVGDKIIVRSLRDFLDFIKQRLNTFLNQAQAPSETAPAPESGSADPASEVQDFTEV